MSVKNLTIDQMREIVAGASEYEKYWITQGEYHCHVLSFPNMTGQKAYKLNAIRAAIAEHDQYWYGQSEGDAIKEHECYQQELIKGGVVFVGDNSKLVQAIRELDCDHDWEDISTTADLERQLICTCCGLEKSEPLENTQRWADRGEP